MSCASFMHGHLDTIGAVQNGQQYRPHHDFFWDKINSDSAHGGQRVATVLMYLCASCVPTPPLSPRHSVATQQLQVAASSPSSSQSRSARTLAELSFDEGKLRLLSGGIP